MSLIPAFELGLWNAWILVLPIILSIVVIISIMKRRGGGFEEEASVMNEKEKKFDKILAVVNFALWIYPIFLPLKLGTAWFYTGFIIYLVCMVFGVIVAHNFATTPKEKPVTKGVYRISRHPMYFFGFLTYSGIGIASASWLYLLLAAAYIVLNNISVRVEERVCLKKYGTAYREYMDRTPKWIGIPKSDKKD